MQPLATRIRILFRAVLTLVLACASAGTMAIEWQVDITPAGNLFPALALSQHARRPEAAAGDGNGLVSVRIHGIDRPGTLRLTIETPGLRAPTILDVEVPAGGAHAETARVLEPRLDWDTAALRGLIRVHTQILHAILEGPGFARETRDIAVRVHPLDDVLYFVREGSDHVDLGWAFAAYVDAHDPAVNEILAQARDIDPAFDANVRDDGPTGNLRRVAAVWAALERRGLHYADDDPALSHGPVIWSQRVQRPGETWRERRANCLDGSVLIASVLERLGLRAFLVLVPGHAFVGFRNGDDGHHAVYLETTLLNAPSQRWSGVSNFAAARAAGRARWRGIAAKFDGHHGPDYALIDIGTARDYGIIPLAAGERASRNPATVEPAPAAPSQQSGSP